MAVLALNAVVRVGGMEDTHPEVEKQEHGHDRSSPAQRSLETATETSAASARQATGIIRSARACGAGPKPDCVLFVNELCSGLRR
jgi:hypothetical protein